MRFGELVRALWSGDIPLPRTFWTYGIGWGLAINFASTILALAAWTIVRGEETGAIGLLALAIAVAPIPYNLFILVAVWRSAGRYTGPPHWASLARIAYLVWAVAASIS